MIVRLAAPPLAAWNAARQPASARAAQHLNVHSTAAAGVRRAARAPAGRRRSPRCARRSRSAVVQERYSILLDGFAVQLPAKSLPKLLRVERRHEGLSEPLVLRDDGPRPVGDPRRPTSQAATGDKGQGVKIAVVDTGVDPTSPFLNPAGFSYPAGLPEGRHDEDDAEGDRRQGLPRRAARQEQHEAVRPDRAARHARLRASRPATRARTHRPAPTIPPSRTSSGVAPKAWIGNYRVFTVPTPLGHEASTPEIVHAFEAAVADGMNVINFSGGGPQTDPVERRDVRDDPQRHARRRRAGDRRRQRPRGLRLRHGRLAGRRSRRDRGRRDLELARVRAGALRQRRAAVARRGPDPGRRRREAARPRGRRSTRRSSTSRRSWAPTASRSTRTSAARRRDPNTGNGHAAGRLADRQDRARVARHLHLRLEGGPREARRRDRPDPRRQPLRRGERDPDPAPAPGRDDLRPRRLAPPRLRVAARRPGDDPRLERHPRDPDRPQRRDHELLVRRPDRLRLVPEARHLGARARRPLLDAAADDRLDVLGLRRHVDGDAARRRRGRAARAAPSELDAARRSSRR